MSESAGKWKKVHVNHTKDSYKPTRIIHGPGYSSYECKVWGDFGSKYAKNRPTKDRGQDQRKFNSQQDNNSIVNSLFDEILLQENQKVSTENWTKENIESDSDENELYQINSMSLDDKKTFNGVWVRLNTNLIKFRAIMVWPFLHDYGVNNIFECNLIHDKPNSLKRTNNLNRNYSTILMDV